MQSTAHLKQQVLEWASRFGTFMFLDSCDFPDRYGRYLWIAAAGSRKHFDNWEALSGRTGNGWLFGHLGYEAHRQMGVYQDVLSSPSDYPDIGFFEPETVVCQRRGEAAIRIYSGSEQDAEDCYRHILETPPTPLWPLPTLHFQKAFRRDAYCDVVEKLRAHIRSGDCYEINFCNARIAQPETPIDWLSAYRRLSTLSPAPFSVYYQTPDFRMAGASPERYLRLSGNTLISQPIKGTARRQAAQEADVAAAHALRHSRKEQAENVMITDLTRSDFARVCQTGSVAVDSLFEVQTFPQVHQLVSTVTGELLANHTIWDAIRTSFPMGSMTGAPRQKVMDLIRQYEAQPRGLFSGTVGYVDPDGHADFNVVIRSVYETGNAVRFNTGGAITWGSNAAQEWEECLLKGRAIESIFSGNTF